MKAEACLTPPSSAVTSSTQAPAAAYRTVGARRPPGAGVRSLGASSSRCLPWTGSTAPHGGDCSTHATQTATSGRSVWRKREQRFWKVLFVFLSRFRSGWLGCRFLIGTTPPLPLWRHLQIVRACSYPAFDQRRPSAESLGVWKPSALVLVLHTHAARRVCGLGIPTAAHRYLKSSL